MTKYVAGRKQSGDSERGDYDRVARMIKLLPVEFACLLQWKTVLNLEWNYNYLNRQVGIGQLRAP